MNYSINPIIETWLSGILFLISTCLFFFLLFGETCLFESILDVDSKWISLIVIISCSFSYSIGWAVNYLTELLLDTLFQHSFRNKLEVEEKVSFYTVRSYVFQYGSDQILNDLKYDRQIIRIARSNFFNFFLMGVIISFYLGKGSIPDKVIWFLLIFCIGVSFLSFFQWQKRYKATYKKFYQAYFALPLNNTQEKPNDIHMESNKIIHEEKSSQKAVNTPQMKEQEVEKMSRKGKRK